LGEKRTFQAVFDTIKGHFYQCLVPTVRAFLN
jgi:hypothetical protein